MPGSINLVKGMPGEVIGTGVNLLLLLPSHVVKLPSKFSCLYPRISAVPRLHERSSLLQWTINTETHN